jgi:glycosyltransferase involved in cell wall biosynthesis
MVNDDLEQRRSQDLRQYAIAQALARLATERPGFEPEAIVAAICAYEEEGNIAGVLEKMPASIDGAAYTTLVVVDGGEDATASIARSFPGVVVLEFPVNLGHGIALQTAYRYCVSHGVAYVVTLDADGQNDPAEIPQILAPLVADQSDFVLGSRVLGVDKTSDRIRKSYRAMRVTMLADVVDRLTQQQYQTSETLITCLKRGWRASEVPTIWHPRFSGETKKGKTWIYGFRYARVVFGTWWRER